MKYFNLIILIFFLAFTATGFAVDEVTKTYCASTSQYNDNDEARADLLRNAKLAAVNELFGELIAASTAVENAVVTSDEIRLSSIGFVRIQGNGARYFNGENFGESCVEINAYVTAEDRKKFEPLAIEKRKCVTEPSMGIGEIKPYAQKQAVLSALIDYNRKLEQVDPETVLKLLQQVQYSDQRFIPDTETYCVRVAGKISPIEVLALLNSPAPSPIQSENSKPEKQNVESIYQNITGEWEGVGRQNDGSSWLIDLQILDNYLALDQTGALIKYPSLDCSGIWILRELKEDTLIFEEKITYGQSHCVASGVVKIVYNNDNTLGFFYSSEYKGSSYSATSTLKQKSN